MSISSPKRLVGSMTGPTLVGLCYFLAAFASLVLTRGADGRATIWPPSGLFLAALLLASSARLHLYVAAAAVGSFAANWITGSSALASLGFTCANMAESLLAAWLLRRGKGYRLSFVNPVGLRRFCIVACAAPALSATLGSLATSDPSSGFFLSWFSTDLLGILVVTPIVLIIAELLRTSRSDLPPGVRWPEAAMLLAGVTVVTGAVFVQSSYPLLFVPMACVIVTIFRLGPLGATASILLTTLIGSLATALGYGPVELIGSTHGTKIFFLQLYLVSLLASAMPVAALLANRQHLLHELAGKNRQLEEARVRAERSAADALMLAETDPLTGLPNRRKAIQVLEEEIALARGPVSVALIDIDYFKTVNDRFGHSVGDRVLQRIARAASAALHEKGLIGRYGGEEFILLLPEAFGDRAVAAADRIRRVIAEGGATDADGPPVTASVGLASLVPGEDLDSLIARADAALYEAKRAGRDKLRLAA